MISRLPNLPKLLPMLYGLFCMRLHSFAKTGQTDRLSNQDIESIGEGYQEQDEQASRTSFFSAHLNRVFLVPRMPAPTVFMARPALQQSSTSRLLSWVKHSVLRMPRTGRVLG